LDSGSTHPSRAAKWRTSANALIKGGGLGSSWKCFTISVLPALCPSGSVDQSSADLSRRTAHRPYRASAEARLRDAA
jgi:hypothetical protein